MEAEFNFHNVGQGLFYTGQIDEFNFVYDCGSKSNSIILKNATDNYQNKINLLFLSHFHEDHTNGLNDLLTQCKTEDTIAILPYFTPMARLYMAISAIESYPEWWFSFMSDPVNYLINEKKIKQVIFIGSDGEKRSDSIVIPNFESMPNDPTLSKIIEDNEQWGQYKNNQILVKNHNCILKLSEKWRFKIYNHSRDLQLKDFENMITPIIGDNIINAIKDPEIRIKISIAYSKIYNQRYLNQTSLMLFHAPIIYEGYVGLSCSRFFKTFYTIWKYGQLLTGDISLVTRWKEIYDHFKKELKEVNFVQIPHHGSIWNWKQGGNLKIDALNEINAEHWINSAGISNEKHPSKTIVTLLLEYNRSVHCSNELNKVIIKFDSVKYSRLAKLDKIIHRSFHKSHCNICSDLINTNCPCQDYHWQFIPESKYL